MSDEVPEWAKLYIDLDVAQWLHELAADRYGGDVQKTMNVVLRSSMIMHKNPDDPWAGLNYESGTKGPSPGYRKAQQKP